VGCLTAEKLRKIKERVLEQIKTLKPGDLVRVSWRDASLAREVRILTDRAFVTKKVTTGYFQTVAVDPETRMQYLILYHEVTDGEAYDNVNIPMTIITKIEKILNGHKIPKRKDREPSAVNKPDSSQTAPLKSPREK